MEFELCEGQFTLKEEEELVSIATDRMLKLKHAELNSDAFWILVQNEYSAITEKALQLLLQFSTSYMCEFGFSAMTTIKHKNSLPNWVISAYTTDTFNARLDKFWHSQDIVYAFRAQLQGTISRSEVLCEKFE